MKKMTNAIMLAIRVANTIVTLCELYDYGMGMYRKHILKPKRVDSFASEPTTTGACDMNAKDA